MITIGYSTRNSNPELQEYFRKTCGLKNVQIIEKVNNGEKSLNETYNEILEESNNDIIIFCHDDIYFDTKAWGFKIIEHFKKGDYGILGVAGSTFIPKSGRWWEDRRKMVGIVNHEHNGKKWESKYSGSQGNSIKETILIDGLFIAIDKKRIVKKFNENLKGFHFYDLEFCLSNYTSGVKIGVLTNIRITHKSIGMTNQEWENNRKVFSENYKSILPIKLPKNTDEKLKVLISTRNIDEIDLLRLLEIAEQITNKHDVFFMSDVVDKKHLDFLRKSNIKTYNYSEPPGYKLGDGVWQFNTPEGIKTSEVNNLYRIKETNFDLILIEDVQNISNISNLYPKIEKIAILSYYGKPYNSDTTVKREITFSELTDIDINELLFEVVNSVDYIPNQKIKIMSGHSERGGSTTALINLTNELNSIGYDCTFYGPHDWHLDKCKSANIEEIFSEPDDIFICHFVHLKERPQVKKVILSLHEKNLFEISDMKPYWDEVVFLNESHKDYHFGYNGPYTIIPNLTEKLQNKEKNHLDKVAGIIGTIDENKQTHISIERAVADNCEKIYLFGTITDPVYFENFVKSKLSDKVILMGHVENKQEMYDMIGRVYISSKSEVACLIKDECSTTNTKFFGNEVTSHLPNSLKNEDIINKWVEIFEK